MSLDRVCMMMVAGTIIFTGSTTLVIAQTPCKSHLLGICTSWYAPLPTIPAPKGFIEASALSAKIKNTFSSSLNTHQHLLGVWYEPDVVARIVNSTLENQVIYYRAVLEMELESPQAASTELREYSKKANIGVGKPFDLDDPATIRLVREFEQWTKNTGNTVTGKLVGMTQLGSIAESSIFRADSAIFALQRSDASEPTILAMTMGLIQIGKQLISLSVANPFTGKASILAANNMLLTWLNTVYKANSVGK
jgi:hypothetical protein